MSTQEPKPASESAEELVRALIPMFDCLHPEDHITEGIKLIVAHDAETLRQAADRGIPALCRICEREWGKCQYILSPCNWKREMEATILGEGKGA